MIGWCWRRRSAGLLCARITAATGGSCSLARAEGTSPTHPEDAALADRLSGNAGVGDVWRSGVSYSMTDNRSLGEAVSVRGVALWITHDN